MYLTRTKKEQVEKAELDMRVEACPRLKLGRPNWDEIIAAAVDKAESMTEAEQLEEGGKSPSVSERVIGVFFCGAAVIGQQIEAACYKSMREESMRQSNSAFGSSLVTPYGAFVKNRIIFRKENF
ncbi:hypothetical protein CYMTET_33535 [Cymbomonas tetramitiformis]|uniref:Uncharacterized protein n=1 Tax=Cymbomonas tetramitiformis TaxID=36881 RepID=A0AAE0FDH4_9CHLO|nr:hypothetical protein CYMTET_33535 [Cymbomonas tetramitiformis]